jgi:hypothetical protein
MAATGWMARMVRTGKTAPCLGHKAQQGHAAKKGIASKVNVGLLAKMGGMAR